MNPVSKPVAKSGSAHILVIDDDQDLLRLLSMRVHAWGYRVSTAVSAEEGLARIAVEPPQLVLSDIRLPGKDGLAPVSYTHLAVYKRQLLGNCWRTLIGVGN